MPPGWDAALLLSVGGLALTAAHTAAVRRDRVGPLSRQLSAAVAIAIGQMLLAVVAVGELMFVSRHDAVVLLGRSPLSPGWLRSSPRGC